MPESTLTTPLTPLTSPADLRSMHPLRPVMAKRVAQTRQEIIDVLTGRDSRMLAIVGPCSLDDSRQPDGEYSAVAFAKQLKALAENPAIAKELLVIMRCPPAKPRTDLGHRGLEQTSIETAREILAQIANLGMPLASEIMHARHLAQYGDLLSVVWTGARNGDDTNLRHALSASAIPVLCKNGSDGTLTMAINALKTIRASHPNVELVMSDGRTGRLPQSEGNPNALGLLYRGGANAANAEEYESHILAAAKAAEVMDAALLADAAHGGSVAHSGSKSAEGQKLAHQHLMQLLKNGLPLKGIMAEAYLHEGNDPSGATPGMSLTDPCIDFATLRTMLFATAQTKRDAARAIERDT